MKRHIRLAVVGLAIALTGACGSVTSRNDGGTGGASSGGQGGSPTATGGSGDTTGSGGSSSGGHGGGSSTGGSGGGSATGGSGGVVGHVCGPDATCTACVTGACCGTGCCASGEWCDTSGSVPTCRCNAAAACGSGQSCASSLAGGATCGIRCCGGDAGACPVSRRMYKRDIERLDDDALGRIYDELRNIQLTTYQYKSDPAASPRRLGFIIDDTKTPYPVNADGNSVNLYGYVSMAVAAIQTQSRELEALRTEIAQLRHEQSRRRPALARGGR
jgi:hypothetical protein